MRNTKSSIGLLVRGAAFALVSMLAGTVHAAAPGITGVASGTTKAFDLTAAPGFISQPDGASVYSWGYGCTTAAAAARFVPATVAGANCLAGKMQLPGPTLVVNQGDTVTVTLTNSLPAAAGNTSILFPGFNVTATGGAAGVLAQEAAHSGTVMYSFVASTAGTHSYYSGTQGDLQVEMGLYGALIVLPTLGGTVPTGYQTQADGSGFPNTCFVLGAKVPSVPKEARLAMAAYDHPSACYDREYLFQLSEMDPAIHRQAEEQAGVACTQASGCMVVNTEPYHPTYFLINGRSFPDVADPHYAGQYPRQPYNGNPHMHPGELVLLRVIGHGRTQHPFHEHGNHVRVLARDGNMLLSTTAPAAGKKPNLAGPLLFTTTTTPGQTLDGIFQYTAKNLNWDVYGHTDGITTDTCVPDANGFYTTGSSASSVATALNYYEWCADHKKPLENHPFGLVGSGGPVTLPDPGIFANGPWYGGSPYLGPEATGRAVGSTPIPPSGTVANDPTAEAGFAFMWHSHNEREITTNNIFPGGMMMMMLVDPWSFLINEAN